MVHKTKNQIGSLYHSAKVQEMQIMEGRLRGVSHKVGAVQARPRLESVPVSTFQQP